MAREILFKAKRIDNGEWVEGYLGKGKRYYDGKPMAIIMPVNVEILSMCSVSEYEIVDPNTICQYTGLTDKNGNKIWENDIVVHSYTRYEDSPLDYPPYKSKVHKKNYAIEWDSTPSYCGYRYHNGRNIFPFKIGTVINGDDEVIGNIFDNPELLKGE